jgi:hypothetical protein
MALRRDRRFRRLLADTKAAMERGDAEGTRELLRRCSQGNERVAAGELFGYSSPLGKNEPPDLLLELYERVRRVPLSVIDAYARPPESLEAMGRELPEDGCDNWPPVKR